MTLKNFDKFIETGLYGHYYDHTHFIKEFKRFSGFSPFAYAKKQNEVGEIFYPVSCSLFYYLPITFLFKFVIGDAISSKQFSSLKN
jgi:hypothetical protein